MTTLERAPKWMHLPTSKQEVVPDPHCNWLLAEEGDVCSHPRCRAQAVAILARNPKGTQQRKLCPTHLLRRGRWVENGQVVIWDVPPSGDQEASGE